MKRKSVAGVTSKVRGHAFPGAESRPRKARKRSRSGGIRTDSDPSKDEAKTCRVAKRSTDSRFIKRKVMGGALDQRSVTTTEPSIFPVLPIDRSKDMFRLFRFDDDLTHGQMSLRMEAYTRTAMPHQGCPPYTALSYVWGSVKNTRNVLVNGQIHAVTSNLLDFLTVLRAKDHNHYAPKWFWADQICVDQTNVQERGHQVGLMSEIYWSAREVFAYMGSEAILPSVVIETADQALPSRIMTSPYWCRLWIIQELQLAQDISLWCGDRRLSRRQALRQLEMRQFSNLSANQMLDNDLEVIIGLLDERNSFGRIHDRYMSLEDALHISCRSQCAEPRDKIFGVQALVTPKQRVSVDYAQPISRVNLQAVRNLIRTRLRGPLSGISMFCLTGWSTNRSQVQEISDLVPNLPKTHRGKIAEMLWSGFMGSIMTMPDSSPSYHAETPRDIDGLRLSRSRPLCVFRSSTALRTARELATTSRQKLFMADLKFDLLKSFSSEYTETGRGFAYLSVLVAKRAGFMLHGTFLSHPCEWPFSDEAGTTPISRINPEPVVPCGFCSGTNYDHQESCHLSAVRPSLIIDSPPLDQWSSNDVLQVSEHREPSIKRVLEDMQNVTHAAHSSELEGYPGNAAATWNFNRLATAYTPDLASGRDWLLEKALHH